MERIEYYKINVKFYKYWYTMDGGGYSETNFCFRTKEKALEKMKELQTHPFEEDFNWKRIPASQNHPIKIAIEERELVLLD